MHPCREYWGQDVAYGSLVSAVKARRADRAATATEFWILDTGPDAHAVGHAGLAGLMDRIRGLDTGEESLRQSAAHLREFLRPGEDGRVLGIATVHRTRTLPTGSFAAAAQLPASAVREPSSALLCAEFMRHLGALGAAGGVAQIDWVMVRASGPAGPSRAQLGATRVAGLALAPFDPAADVR